MARPHGTKYIQTPEKMWELFEEFVAHEKNNPFYKVEYVGKDGSQVDTPLQVPITFEAFECWLADKGIIQDLGQYSANRDNCYSDYIPILTRIRNNCFAQNFKGAAVGIFNASIIAKKLGLAEKIQTENTNISILNIDPLADATINNITQKDSGTS